MHGTGGIPVSVTTIGGLVTLAKSETLPEGASPRTYDFDYDVGSGATRAGLTRAASYAQGTSVGPLPGGAAADIDTEGLPWASPDNTLVNLGTYAVASLGNPALNIVGTQGIQQTDPVTHVTVNYTVVTFSSEAPGELSATYTFSGLTTNTPLNGQFLSPIIPIAFYPLTPNQQIFLFSSPFTGFQADTGSAVVSDISLISDSLQITQFALDVPSTSRPQGFLITSLIQASASYTLTCQLLKNGVAVGSPEIQSITSGQSSVTWGAVSDLFNEAWLYSDLNATNFGLQITASNSSPVTASVGYTTLTIYLLPAASNFDFIGTFVAQNGLVKNIALDANGNLWIQDVVTGILTLATEGITPNSYSVAVNGPDVEYMAISNLSTGSDGPLQYTPKWIDRITQVGPGVAPTFTPILAPTNTFAISTITQYPANSDITDPGHLSVLLQSAGPGSTAPGNVLTVYYSPSFFGGAPQPSAQDLTLVNAFNAGNAVYVYISGTGIVDGTYLVTSVGNALPPGVDHFRYYFTVQLPTAAYQNIVEAAGQYQMTVATLTTSVPVPGLAVGNEITISGSSVSSWDAQWPVSQTINSSQMAITGTQVTASVATYNYALSGGSTAAPQNGQLVTVTGTTNANGALNVTNATIVSASGGSTGTFTVSVPVVTAAFAPEDGQATTAGTIFAFDPGIETLGTSSNPIFGNATGGTLTFIAATAQLIATGTKQGSVFFITRNGYYTCPAPPVTFTVPENTTALAVTGILQGPPNVVARGIILTESGQNGVPGANFFTIPDPVTYIVENQSYTASALIINDNVSTSAMFQFTDSVLLNALAVDVYGYNLFNQIEIGDPGWVAQYDGRGAFGLCRNKIQNFNNLSFDGGFLVGTGQQGQTVPSYWSQPDIYGSLIASAKFGNSYYIKNTSSGTLAVAGLIEQTAYQDAYLVPIIQPNIAYSVRVTVAIPSGNTAGNLVISLVANGIIYGSYTLPFASMTTNYAIYEGTLLLNELATVPSALMIVVQATNIGAGADLAIDRIDPIPTAIPILTTTVYFSYGGLFEQVDSVTGAVVFSSENQQPVNGGMVLYDTFYGLKGWGGNAPGSSLYSLQASSNLEPAQWQEPEVAQKSGGAIGPLAFDLGEQWFIGASRQGLYLFEGGQPGKIMHEIYQVWDAINWEAGNSIWVKVDIVHRKIFVGVPLPTPNFWLPNAPASAAPTVIQSVQVNYVGPRVPSTLIVTFRNPLPPLTPDQTYTFSGLTNYTALNGDVLTPVEVSGNVATFLVGDGTSTYSGLDTGTATISGVSALTSPNVILVCNYQGVDSGQELKNMPQMHTTMFGTLNAIDMRRKWSIWQIPSPYAAICQGQSDEELFICNGRQNSQIYFLDDTAENDDGLIIDSLYTTAGLPEQSKRTQMQGIGNSVVRYNYGSAALQSAGKVQVRLLPNRLLFPEPSEYASWSLPGGLTPGDPALYDAEFSANFAATRTFVEFRENDGSGFSLSNLVLIGKRDVWNQFRGRTGTTP
jgi:hypothetical protein